MSQPAQLTSQQQQQQNTLAHIQQQTMQQQNVCSQLPPTPTKLGHTIVPGQFALKKLLPIACFFMGFATVMTLLVIYMENKALRHHQFNINMTQEYELNGVHQDNTDLIAVIKLYYLKPAVEPNHRPIEFTAETPTQDVELVLKSINNKVGGTFVEAGAYSDSKTSETEWLEKKLNWKGLLIQPDPRHYFNLNRHNRIKSQAFHGCLSPAPYFKEITYHQEERDGVKVNSINSNTIDDSDSFITRVKCFPLYSLLLAMNMTTVDYFSLESRGTELQVLETIPFDRVRINFIDVHLLSNNTESDTIKEFLSTKNYSLMQNFNGNFIYKFNQ